MTMALPWTTSKRRSSWSGRRSTRGWRWSGGNSRMGDLGMPERMIEERFSQLGDKVERATEQLEADRAARVEARSEDAALRRAEEEKRRWFRRFALAGLVVGVIGLGLAAFALSEGKTARDAAWTAQAAIDEANNVRATARVASCEQAVEYATAHNDLVRRTQALLVAVGSLSSREETQRFVEEQISAYEANIVPVRDCSPEGLEAFADGTGGYLP